MAEKAIAGALMFKGPAIVVLKGECQLQVQRRTKKGETQTWIDFELCTGCKACVQLGCPAITFDTRERKAGIDEIICVDCTLCVQVCEYEAIKMGGRD